MVNSDGWEYVEYEVRNVVNNVITSDSLYLQEIAPTDNSFPTVLLSTTTQNQALLPGPIVPDGQGGRVPHRKKRNLACRHDRVVALPVPTQDTWTRATSKHGNRID
jgi:hypothetical protein